MIGIGELGCVGGVEEVVIGLFGYCGEYVYVEIG